MLVASTTARPCLALLGVQPLEDSDMVLASLAAKAVMSVGVPLSGKYIPFIFFQWEHLPSLHFGSSAPALCARS